MEFSKYVENAIKVNGKILNGKLIEIVKQEVGGHYKRQVMVLWKLKNEK